MTPKSNIVSLDEALRSSSNQHKASPAAKLREAHIPGLMASIQALASQVFGQHLRKMLEKSDDAFFELADNAPNNEQQNIFFDSMREIRAKRDEIEQIFLERINQSLAYHQNAAKGAVFSEPSSSIKTNVAEKNSGIDKLSLMDENSVEEMLAIDTMSAKFESIHCAILVALDARFAHLAGIDASQRGQAKWINPISPKSICKHFSEACKGLSIDMQARIVLFKLFEKHMQVCLTELYQRTNEQLLQANVLPELPANFAGQKADEPKVSTKSRSPEALAESDFNEQALNTNTAMGTASTVTLFDEQRRQFADFVSAQSYLSMINANNTPHYAPFLANQISLIPASEQPQLNSQSLHSIMHGLQLAPNMPTNSVASPEGIIKTFLQALLKSAGAKSSIAKQDRDVIGLVSILFKFIIDDRVVAEPMKAAISRLQVPFIKVALNEASFFNQPQHPSRQLLNTMTQATVGWIPNDDWQNDALYMAICVAVERIVTEYEQDIQIFSEVEEELKAFIENEGKRTEMRKKRVVDAEEGRDQTAMVRAQIDEIISEYLEDGVPDFVETTLRTVWSNWLFIIYHQDGENSNAWQSGIEAVRELVWTVSPKRCAAHRHEMLALLPDLIKSLRAGFDAISYDKQAVATFFKRLEKMHLHIMERISPIGFFANGTSTVSPDVAVDETAKQNDTVLPEVAIQEEDAISSFQLQAKELNVGQWIELLDDNDKKIRCRLVAILRNSGNRIFVNRSGVKTAELSIDDIAQHLENDRIVLLEDAKLFDKALTSIIDNLRSRKKAIGV